MDLSGLSSFPALTHALALLQAHPGEKLALDVGLPALAAVAGAAKPDGTRSVLVTHVLPTAVGYVNQVNRVYPVEAVVAVPYSADPEAVAALKKQGYRVIVPKDVPDLFVEAAKTVTAALQASNKPLVVQEVGGYLAESTKEFVKFAHFRGVVEDTNNGHWRYDRFGPHPCPVLSIAQSPLKDVEDSIIGDAVVYSIERVLREEYRAVVPGIRAAVIGYGKIGGSTATALRGRKAVVSIYDINPFKNIRAGVDGFFPLPLHPLLRQADLVVGCTGQTSVRGVDLPFIKTGAVLVSASSKDIEFDLKAFGGECQVTEVSPMVRRYDRKDGSHFYLLNKGTPINFRDRSILGTMLDLIYTELLVCMKEVVEGRAKKGLHHAPADVQNEVAKAWMRAHAPAFAAERDDKVWDYPESLKLGLPK